MPFDPTGEKLDEGQLNWGYWWVTHQARVRTVATALFGAVAVSLFLYGAWGIIDWFFVSGVRERYEAGLILHARIPLETFRAYGAKTEPFIDASTVLPAGEGRYDVFTTMTNANEAWAFSFAYRFEIPGAATPTRRAFLLPGETKRVHALGIQAAARPSSAPLVISDARWQRVDPHLTYPGYREWAARRLDIAVEQPTFMPPTPGDALAVSRARFTVANRTAFSYHTVGLFVTAYAGTQPVGVNYVTISRLMAGERRPVEVTWTTPLANVTRVEVQSEVNILDAAVYIAPGR